jgi:hypothetical protein
MLNTVTGLQVNPESLKPEEVRAYDIAWALHHLNLFGGHTPVEWDALSHSGLAYMLYVQDTHGQTEVSFSLALLLTGTGKAYVESLVVCADVEGVIFKRFNIPQGPAAGMDWDQIDRYDKQATAIEFYHLFPHLRGTQHAPSFAYAMTKYPILVKAKVEDYITLLKHLSINHGVDDVGDLFALPESLRPYLKVSSETEEVVEQAHVDADLRETRSVEELQV